MRGFVADAYREAALAQADMRRVVDVLEPLTTATVDISDPFVMWRILDGKVAQATGDLLQKCITTLRTQYVDEVGRLAIERIEKASRRGHAEGSQEWLRTYADALGEFRFALCGRLVEEKPSCDPGPPSSFRQWTDDAIAGRWNHVMPGIRYLLDHAPLDARERALLLPIEAEVEIYWLGDYHTAKRKIDEAITLWPEGPRGWQSLGAYHAETEEQDDAIRAFERSLKLDPGESGGYRGLGDIALERSDLENAERYYLNGTTAAAGSADNYRALIDLYGRPELFADNESRLDLLAERAICAEPDSEYTIIVALGRAYRDNNRYGRAEELFTSAIGLFPDRSDAYGEYGYLLLEKEELARAREQFEMMVSLAPDFVGGHLGLGFVCEREDDWEGAVRCYEESARLAVGRGRPNFQAQLAKAQLRAGSHRLAADTVLAAIAEHPTAEVLLSTVSEIAIDRARAGDRKTAKDLADRLRTLRGTVFEAGYHDLLGEVALVAGDYGDAIAAFRRAIDVDGGIASYHHNLACALRQAEEWSPAKEEGERAFALDGNEVAYRRELSTIFNEEANALISAGRYEKAIEGYQRAIELTPEEAVFYSNLAIAYEWGAQPGHRLEALQGAIAAAARAAELSDDGGYSLRLIRLERAEAAVRRFGELILTPSVVVPIRVEFASDLVHKVNPAQGSRGFLETEIPAMKERVRQAVGYEVPGVRLAEDPALPPGGYVIKLFGMPTARGHVVADHLCVMPPEAVSLSDTVPGQDPVTGMPCVWVDARHLNQAGLVDARHLSDTNFALRHLEALLRRHSFWFLGTDEAESWITAAAESDGIEQSRLSPRIRIGLTRVLRALVRDGVKIDRLGEILAAIGDSNLSPEEVPGAIQQIRMARRKALPGNANDVVQLAVDLPRTAGPWDARALDGWGRPLAPDEEQRLVTTIAAELDKDARNVLVVSEPLARGYLRRLVESGVPKGQDRVVDVLTTREILHPQEAGS